jgi:hypothetical protein
MNPNRIRITAAVIANTVEGSPVDGWWTLVWFDDDSCNVPLEV